MHAKTVILSQWKLISHLKSYFSKITTDRTFENALNKEFAHFLQKIDPKTYGKDMIRYFSSTMSVETNQDKSTVKGDQEKSVISFPNVFGNMFKDDHKSDPVPKWKTIKHVVSKV